ncbi:MAG: RluA family pseudouridine synthase [Flavobacteriaceae bacterium]|nr:RluA family pseudouridine synthase [Flavobacteriaceae bacterium]
MESIVTAPSQKPISVSKFLTGRLYGLGSDSVMTKLQKGEILLNGQVAKASDLVQGHDIISIETDNRPNIVAEDIPLHIVFENENVLVLNKPAGMAMHKGLGVYNGTLLNALAGYYEKSGQTSNVPNGLAHRLDKNTSGLVVVGKSAEARNLLSLQFADKSAKRIYTGYVWNNPGNSTLDLPIGRDPKNETIIKVLEEGGKEAVTHFRTLHSNALWSKMEWELETGRTHQIRVHMHHLVCPILADERYTIELSEEQAHLERILKENYKGHFLHATKLSFIEPITKEELSFECAEPFRVA